MKKKLKTTNKDRESDIYILPLTEHEIIMLSIGEAVASVIDKARYYLVQGKKHD